MIWNGLAIFYIYVTFEDRLACGLNYLRLIGEINNFNLDVIRESKIMKTNQIDQS